ncbi:MAG: thioredoxin domain-containing protein [Deltaproteobacteria bacterium]|nr:thioredoxin domain-containing protein [Deltaproteobacteria bacterium]
MRAGNSLRLQLFLTLLAGGFLLGQAGKVAAQGQLQLPCVIFSEFQCPFCARVGATLDSVLKEYPGKVRLVYRHNPLPFHKQAMPAARASLAAARQGRFWEMHDKLFQDRKKLDEDSLFGYASQLGLDMQRFEADFRSEAIVRQIKADMAEAARLGSRGVPAFFINGRSLSGAQPLAKFKTLIDELLPLAIRAGGSGDPLYQKLTSCGLTSKPVTANKPKPGRPADDPDRIYQIPANESYWTGSHNPRVTIVVFSDFCCPYCNRGAKTLIEVLENYPQQVRIIFKHHPLTSHKDAFLAHMASLAAGAQGKFWQMHDLLFENQRKLKRENLIEYANKLELDMPRFKADLESRSLRKEIERDTAFVMELGARGTPTFFINGKKIVGAIPYSAFKARIEQELLVQGLRGQ